MPQRNPWDTQTRPWDERIGADASITHVSGGKKIFHEITGKSASNVPLPQGDQPFLVPMPGNGTMRHQTPVMVDTNIHVWRSYRTITATAEGVQGEGKKMNARPLPMIEVQAHIRKSLRDKLRDQERKELMLKKQHDLEREAMLVRHANHASMEETFLRTRAKTLGFEGLHKPVTRPPPSMPSVAPEELQRIVDAAHSTGGAARMPGSGGKRVWADHPCQRSNGSPFGSSSHTPTPGVSEAESRAVSSMRRWEDKCLP
jgi:hypothetical protein